MIDYNVKNYIIKKISEVNQNDLLEFYSKVYSNISKNYISKIKWYYRLGFNSHEPIVILVNEKVIGHAGLIPAEIMSNKKLFNCIWFVDFAVLPEFQSKGYGKKLTEAWMSICPNQITFCNDISLSIFKKYNWKSDFSVKRKIHPVNFLKIIPFIKTIKLKSIENFQINFLKKKFRNASTIKPYKITRTILDNIIGLEKRIIKKSPYILRNESWFNWRLLECPYKEDIYYFENQSNFVIGHVFFQGNLKRMNLIHTNMHDTKSSFFQSILKWSIENQIDFLWYLEKEDSQKSKSIFSNFYEKKLNFAYNSSDSTLSDELKTGFSNPSGIDSDIDYIFRDR